MGFFDDVPEEITPKLLKKWGFYKDRWGSPQDRKLPTSVFYEKCIYDDINGTVVVATIKYFPKDFDRYTSFKLSRDWYGWGFGAGKFVVIYEHSYWEPDEKNPCHGDTRIFDAFHPLCYEEMKAALIKDLKSKDYNVKNMKI
jgi:hypothetical protein